MYFDCTYGCDIKLIETDQIITLECNSDVVIDNVIYNLNKVILIKKRGSSPCSGIFDGPGKGLERGRF